MAEAAAKTESSPQTDGETSPLQMQVQNLCKSFGGNTVLEEISFELREGEVVLLRGKNGSGKTTLLNILTGHLEPDAGQIELRMNDQPSRFSFPRPLWKKANPFDTFLPEHIAQEGVGRTWQDIRLFSKQSLLDNVAVATQDQPGENLLQALFRPFRSRQSELENREDVSKQIAALDLEGRQSSSADKISLGQSKRIAILRAVRAGAKVLFLDEPLSGLDAPGITDVLELLRRLSEERNITLVIVEHVFNIPQVLELASTVWTLADGQLTTAPANEIDPEAGETADTSLHHIRTMTGSHRTMECPLSGGASLTKFVPDGQKTENPILEIENLTVRRGPRLVLGSRQENGAIEGLSMSLYPGEWGILRAPNGWGKTTLLEAIAGTIPVEQGTIRINGQPVSDSPPWRRNVSLLQSRDHAFPSLTVREVLELNEVDSPLEELIPMLDRPVGSLSGGETQKVAISCALSGKATLRLMDEPFSALDESSIRKVTERLTDMEAKTVLFALPVTDQ